MAYDCEARNQSKVTADDVTFFCYYYIIFFLITIINLCGNSLVICSFVRHRYLRSVENYLILSLASSDLLHGVFYTVYNVSHMEEILAIRLAFDNWPMCLFLLTMVTSLEMTSSFTLLAITWLRYVAIVHPLKSAKITIKTAIVLIVGIWCGCLTIFTALHLMPISDREFCGVCLYERVFRTFHLGSYMILIELVPLTGMILMYIRIASIARKHIRQIYIQKGGRKNSVGKQIQTTVAVGLLLLCFALAFLPFQIYAFLSLLRPSIEISRYIRATFRNMIHANTAINVFIYAGRLQDFRRAFREDLSGLRCRRKRLHMELVGSPECTPSPNEVREDQLSQF